MKETQESHSVTNVSFGAKVPQALAILLMYLVVLVIGLLTIVLMIKSLLGG